MFIVYIARDVLTFRNEATVGSLKFRASSLIVNAHSGRTGASHCRCPTTLRYCECRSESSSSSESVVSVVVIADGVRSFCAICHAKFLKYLGEVFFVLKDEYAVSCSLKYTSYESRLLLHLRLNGLSP